MASNTEEENLENRAHRQEEDESVEDSATHETVSITQTQEPKKMEVHHHAHHEGRKNWKSYFWEFLMLFLAVFCGFLAEYKLEHVIEHQRENQYMQSLISDLENDIINLNEGFPRKDQRLRAIDSIFLYFEKHPNVDKIPGSVYKFMKMTLSDRHYRRNSTTIDQLKNSGAFRLIRNKTVADSIAAYDLKWVRAEFWRQLYIDHQEKAKGFIEKIIIANSLLAEYRNTSPGHEIPVEITDSSTVQINKSGLNEYLNFLSDQKNITAYDKRDYQIIEQSAKNLSVLIKKEYNLH